jgi:hypothetical protein
MKVVPFTPATVTMTDQESVVFILEDLLEEARAGKIQAVGVAIIRPDLSMHSSWSESHAAVLLGGISVLQHRVIESLDG